MPARFPFTPPPAPFGTAYAGRARVVKGAAPPLPWSTTTLPSAAYALTLSARAHLFHKGCIRIIYPAFERYIDTAAASFMQKTSTDIADGSSVSFACGACRHRQGGP